MGIEDEPVTELIGADDYPHHALAVVSEANDDAIDVEIVDDDAQPITPEDRTWLRRAHSGSVQPV